MARQTEVVLLLILAAAVSALAMDMKPRSAADFDKMVRESKTMQLKVGSKCSRCCPPGWVKYDEHCFIYQATKLDWASAERHCLDLDGHLISVHNENGYRLAKSLVRTHDPHESPTWIGLSGCQKRNSWFWSDGTKVSFTKWNPGEPNHKSKECCVHMNWNKNGIKDWNDVPCNQNFPFLCAKKVN